jgi:uncharacterized metal-binding protein YceD (DUF177 family)
MKIMNAFIIPIKGMGVGLHQYDFNVDGTFFESREESPVSACLLDIQVAADRRESMILLQFKIEGEVFCGCDRCLADIKLPISGDYALIVKFDPEEIINEDEVLILHPDAPELDLSDVLYEFICLSVPMVKTYDCENDENPPCDEKVISLLEKTENETPINPLWDDLKNKLSTN